MTRTALTIAALAALLSAGCTGVGPGPQEGDAVTLRYDLVDAATGAVLRGNLTASFVLGSGTAGLGPAVDAAVEGRRANQTFTVDLPAYGEVVRVNRTLPPIPAVQTAPRQDFESFVGNASVGQSFPAYGIYTGVVTAVDNDTVTFRVTAEEPRQEDPVASVGAVLVTTPGESTLSRSLRPVVGANFTIAPPTPFQPNTPLGLPAGAYRTLGATEDQIEYGRSPSGDRDLAGRDLRVVATIVSIQEAGLPVPTEGNFGVRSSPQVKGDPSSLHGRPLPEGGHGGGH